jgi:hypothetical protein
MNIKVKRRVLAMIIAGSLLNSANAALEDTGAEFNISARFCPEFVADLVDRFPELGDSPPRSSSLPQLPQIGLTREFVGRLHASKYNMDPKFGPICVEDVMETIEEFCGGEYDTSDPAALREAARHTIDSTLHGPFLPGYAMQASYPGTWEKDGQKVRVGRDDAIDWYNRQCFHRKDPSPYNDFYSAKIVTGICTTNAPVVHLEDTASAIRITCPVGGYENRWNEQLKEASLLHNWIVDNMEYRRVESDSWAVVDGVEYSVKAGDLVRIDGELVPIPTPTPGPEATEAPPRSWDDWAGSL